MSLGTRSRAREEAEIELPLLLAGPIVRRAERNQTWIWLATSAPRRVRAEIFSLTSDRTNPVGSGDADSLQLGQRLFVHLVRATPDNDRFPTGEPLAYDIELLDEDGEESVRLRDLGLLDGPNSIVYGDMPLPAFFLNEGPRLHVMHGSCRLLHGGGEDAFVAADEALALTSGKNDERPAALFLTGDQIYADDVAGPMINHIRNLAAELMDAGDATSVPDVGDLDDIPTYGRAEIVKQHAGFSSERPENHLMSFGEFAAMYLTAWGPDMWPLSFLSASEAVPEAFGSARVVTRARRKYSKEIDMLERARVAMPAVRRVLANVPTYMMFDDHDVTDDWNLTQAWKGDVRARPAGRRIVANALASYWAFQGWGNDPAATDGSLANAITGYLTDESVDAQTFDGALWDFDSWSFVAPTTPIAAVLDTRTQRHYDSPEGGARLVREGELRRVADMVHGHGHDHGEPLLVVSAVPVFGFELQERRQKYLVGKVGPYEIDFEAWHSNLHGVVDLMHMLAENLSPSICVILSGDVHYAVNARASFEIGNRELEIAQVVSSGFKHANVPAKTALNTLGRLLHKQHVRLGWEKPPEFKAPNAIAKRIASRSVNIDEWAEDTPLFLAPRDVRLLGVNSPPDFREHRVYVRPEGRNRSILIGENNVGLVSIYEDRVVHRVLSRGRKRTRVQRATIDYGAPDD